LSKLVENIVEDLLLLTVERVVAVRAEQTTEFVTRVYVEATAMARGWRTPRVITCRLHRAYLCNKILEPLSKTCCTSGTRKFETKVNDDMGLTRQHGSL